MTNNNCTDAINRVSDKKIVIEDENIAIITAGKSTMQDEQATSLQYPINNYYSSNLNREEKLKY